MYKDFYIGNAQYNWSKAGTITLDRNVYARNQNGRQNDISLLFYNGTRN